MFRFILIILAMLYSYQNQVQEISESSPSYPVNPFGMNPKAFGRVALEGMKNEK